MTKHELRQKLATAVADLYLLQVMLEHALRAGVPPDANQVVKLDATTKLLCNLLAKLDMLKLDPLQESA